MTDPVVPDGTVISDVQTTIPDTPRVVPIEALQAERKARQDLANRLVEFEKAKADAEQADAEKRGEFQRLYEQAKADAEAKASRLAELEAAAAKAAERQAERQKARATALPENLRGLIPTALAGDDLDEFLTKLEGMVVTQPAAAPPSTGLPPGRTQGNGDPDALTPEEEAWAASKGYANISHATIKKAHAAALAAKPKR